MPTEKDAADPGDATFQVRGLTVVDKAENVVVDDVSFEVNKGEVFTIIGPNGAGKTTVFNMISRLYTPTAGRIVFKDEDITKLPMYRRAILGLGYLPQETSIFRGLTVCQNISSVLELSEPDPAARAARRWC
mgnify:CR=1 FL=1